MSLRDEIAQIISGAGYPGGRSFRRADAVLALLREKGRPMWCASVLSNEWVVDDEADAATARVVLLDLGGETE